LASDAIDSGKQRSRRLHIVGKTGEKYHAAR
jgi:hypothetical protein